jgi:hypothetical protein
MHEHVWSKIPFSVRYYPRGSNAKLLENVPLPTPWKGVRYQCACGASYEERLEVPSLSE